LHHTFIQLKPVQISRSKQISIEIKDNGPGMDEMFVREQLSEPWTKQDPFTTSSGLSVHLAYRVIDLMGGHMEISSAPGRGCIVNLEVPVLRRSPIMPIPAIPPSPLDPIVIASTSPAEPVKCKVALVGFNRPEKKRTGLPELGKTLERQYALLGCEIVSVPDADLIIADGEVEEMDTGKLLMEGATTDEIIFLTLPGHDPHIQVVEAAARYGKKVKRIAKPVTPSVVRKTLALHRTHVALSAAVDHNTHDPDSSPDSSTLDSLAKEKDTWPSTSTLGLAGADNGAQVKNKDESRPDLIGSISSLWKPKEMCAEDAIACLSLGDYFSSRRASGPSPHWSPSTEFSGRNSSSGEGNSPTVTTQTNL
jgi:hypothetical protein